ncbi:MAG: TRAP transporter small permease [Rhodospirillales bacterium]
MAPEPDSPVRRQETSPFDRAAELLLRDLPRLIIGSLILVGLAINFANVVGRYLFLSPIIWAEEILIYIMVWCVFIGVALVSWDARHLKMDLLLSKLGPRARRVLNIFIAATTIAVLCIVIPQSWTVVSMMQRLDQRSVVSEIPMTIPHFAVLFGFVLMLLALLVRIRANISTSASEREEVVQNLRTEDEPPADPGKPLPPH